MSSSRFRVRRADLPRDTKQKVVFALLRIALYGMLGLGLEVLFYSLVRIARGVPVVEGLFLFGWHVDPRLELDRVWHAPLVAGFGQSSFWMFPVYGVAAFCFVEPLYRVLYKQHVAVRALVYGLTINAWEVASGWLLYWLTGYQIWFYDDRLNIVHMSTFFITPIWMAAGLLIETIYRELMDPKVRDAIERTIPDISRP